MFVSLVYKDIRYYSISVKYNLKYNTVRTSMITIGNGIESEKGNTLIRNGLVLASCYPKEIKGISEIIQKGNEIQIKTDSPTRGHRNVRYVRVSDKFDLEEFKDLVSQLQKYKPNYIKDLVKITFEMSIRTMRHLLATDQLTKTKSLNQVSRALGHKSKKNSAYYVDWLEVADLLGDDQAIQIIKRTEYNREFSMMRFAIRLELSSYAEVFGN